MLFNIVWTKEIDKTCILQKKKEDKQGCGNTEMFYLSPGK